MSPSECCNITPNTTTIRINSILASLTRHVLTRCGCRPTGDSFHDPADWQYPLDGIESSQVSATTHATVPARIGRLPGLRVFVAQLAPPGRTLLPRQIIGRPTATSVATRCAGRRSIEASTTRSGVDVASTNLMGVPCDAVSFQLPQPRFAKGLARDLIKQQFCRFEVGCIEALREPLIHRREQVAGLGAPSWPSHKFARLVAARSSQRRACCPCATTSAHLNSASASIWCPRSQSKFPRKRCNSAAKNPAPVLSAVWIASVNISMPVSAWPKLA